MSDRKQPPKMSPAEKELAQHFRNYMRSPMHPIYLERFMNAIVDFELKARLKEETA